MQHLEQTGMQMEQKVLKKIINQQTYLNLAESFLLCKFTFTKAANTTNTTLVNYLFWKMFDSVRLYIGTQEVEAVDYVCFI